MEVNMQFIICLSTLLVTSFGFTVVPSFHRPALDHRSVSHHDMISSDLGSILTSVEVFDGSSIVDPVVVSNVFWVNLKAKILAVIIGQLLASVAFAIVSTLVASQIGQVGEFVSQKLFPADSKEKTFIKATDLPQANKGSPDYSKLFICLAIDVIGSSSEVVPILGELTDVIYAPIAATLLRSLYGGSNVIFALEFTEEILPFTDILPLATICWVVDSFYGESDLAKLLQVGIYNSSAGNANGMSTGAIDAKFTQGGTQSNPSLPEQSSGER